MNTYHDLRQISRDDLGALGLQDVAYVKPIAVAEGERKYAIFAANGTQLAVMEDRDVAFAAVRQNDMEPLSVH